MSESKSSLITRAKKNIASRSANTRVGRSTLRKLIGPEGNIILNVIYSVTCKKMGEQLAKENRKDMFKLILKVGILFQEHKLTPDSTDHIQEPIANTTQSLIDAVLCEEEVNVESLCGLFHNIHELVFPLLKPLLKMQSLVRMTNLFIYYGGMGFLSALVNDAEFVQERFVLAEALASLLRNYHAYKQNLQNEQCGIIRCERQRVFVSDDLKRRTGFEGTKFCWKHHQDIVEDMVERPTLKKFLDNYEVLSQFRECLVGDAEMNLLHLYFAITDFKQCNSRTVRVNRVNNIMEKFFSPSSPTFVPLCRDFLQDIESRLDRSAFPPTALFQHIEQEVYTLLEDIFLERFVLSAQFEQFVRSMTLPPEVVELEREKELLLQEAELTSRRTDSVGTDICTPRGWVDGDEDAENERKSGDLLGIALPATQSNATRSGRFRTPRTPRTVAVFRRPSLNTNQVQTDQVQVAYVQAPPSPSGDLSRQALQFSEQTELDGFSSEEEIALDQLHLE